MSSELKIAFDLYYVFIARRMIFDNFEQLYL